MRIPNKLPQFKDKAVLIIATGRQDAVFYRAWDGAIEHLDGFHIPKPRYSDDEGEFKQRGRGITVNTGGVKELDVESIIRDFLREFKRRIKLMPECAKIIIFAPSQIKNKIESALPAEWRKKIKAIVAGNYYSSHPLELVEKIAHV